MNVQILTETINRLTENKEYALALFLVKQHPQYHGNFMFNDAYATLLYCTNRFAQAKKIISYNIKLISNNKANAAALLSCYFLKALCYKAENNTIKAQYYIKKCLSLSASDIELHKQLQLLLL